MVDAAGHHTSALGARPVVDPGNPATFGVHLSYIAAEVGTIDTKLDQLGDKMGQLLIEMAKMPSNYASAVAHQELSRRVDELERLKDKEAGAEPNRQELVATVHKLEGDLSSLRSEYQRVSGALVAIRWTVVSLIIPLAGLAIAVVRLLWQ